MLTPLWLAVAGLPVFQLPVAAVPDRPAAIALAAGDVSLRRPCLRLRCAGSEWETPRAATTHAYAESGNGVVRTVLPGAPAPGVPKLAARRSAHTWIETETRRDRVGARYGVNAVDTRTTAVQVEVGTGYRWQPYADDGGADTGPIARASVNLDRRLGEHGQLQQQTRLEAGRDNAFLRNALSMRYRFEDWSLQSQLELKHDTAAAGGDGRTIATGVLGMGFQPSPKWQLQSQLQLRRDTASAAADDTYTTTQGLLSFGYRFTPHWNLNSEMRLRHDPSIAGDRPRTVTESNLRLRYAF